MKSVSSKGILFTRSAVAVACCLIGILFLAACSDNGGSSKQPISEPVSSQEGSPEPASSLQGAILPGTRLESQIVAGEPIPDLKADKPDPYTYQDNNRWLNIDDYTSHQIVHALQADGRFNDDDAKYRISFHYSHYGGMPSPAGDFNGDGVEDFLNTDHFAWVDGNNRTGEVHLYFGKRGAKINPVEQAPDIIFYGEEIWGKLGISVAPGGDFNGDGKADLLLAGCYTTTEREDGSQVLNAGKVYVIFGGTIDLSALPAKVKVADIGRTLPGVVFEGGHDDSLQIAYANGLEAGDVDGDGISDIIIGSYNPYDYRDNEDHLDWPGRAYVIYGSKRDPYMLRPFKLGVDFNKNGLSAHTFTVPERIWTRSSLGWGAFIVDDINNDGMDELAFGASRGGNADHGAAYLFLGKSQRHPPGETTSITNADITIFADGDDHDLGENVTMNFSALEAVRPAGDINKDGFNDLLIAARYSHFVQGASRTIVGAVGVFYGSRSPRSRNNFADLPHIIYNDRSGTIGQPAMDIGADFNQDGYADILVNDAYYLDWLTPEKNQARGRLWLIKGSKNLKRLIHVERDAELVFLADTRTPGLFGYTWNTGDWNGDGHPDIVIGDHYAGDLVGNIHAGKTYMYYYGAGFWFD